MAGAAEICPHCGHAADPERQDVGDGLLACEHCGELFSRRSRDTIDALYGEAPDTPAADTPRDDTLPIAPEGERVEPYISIPAAQPDEPAPAARPRNDTANLAAHAVPRRRPLATLTWTLGILLLLLALAGQFAYFMRDELARHASLRPLLTLMCEYAQCRIPLMRAPERIRMVAREIRRHPTARDALRVSFTFSNEAAFTQAYPFIRLSFFDMHDRVLAQRRFAPAEYLPQNIDMTAGMAPQGALRTAIEIVDPGAEAVNFTFEFF